MIRLLFSMTHFWARRRILARPSNPIASHSGCALRARATISLTSSSDIAGTWVITSPVALMLIRRSLVSAIERPNVTPVEFRLVKRSVSTLKLYPISRMTSFPSPEAYT